MLKFGLKQIRNINPPYIAFGIFGVINYPLFYVFWHKITVQSYTNFTLRLIATLLCLVLLLRRWWPRPCQRWFILYWYVTVLFSLPFFGTFMFLMNYGSSMWYLNGMLVLFLLVLVVDWRMFFILLLSGVMLGVLTYGLVTGLPPIHFDKHTAGAFSTYIWAIIIGMLFSRNIAQEKEYSKLKGKFETIKLLGSSIAHELRTPLASIYLFSQAIRRAFVGNPNPEVSTALEGITSQTKRANLIIDMLLHNIEASKVSTKNFKLISLKDCIAEGLKSYPFSTHQRKLVEFDGRNDFSLKGDKMLLVQVMHNFLKNALYFIEKAGKGKISIWVEDFDYSVELHFKDTGMGVKKGELKKIFDQFYSSGVHNGTGIGLAFCKMVVEAHGGTLVCQSVEHEFTEFVATFHKVR